MTEREQLIEEIDLVIANSASKAAKDILRRCRAALEAIAVPREPTEAMRKAVRAYYGPGAAEIDSCGELWVVMYDAALQSSESKGGM